MEKLIITAAITGAATVPSLTPYLPLTPEQIAESAIEAAKAGAAIVHIHARRPEDGFPSSAPEHFREILTRIKEKSDVVICITTGGSVLMTVEERAASVPLFKPEMCSFNMGSINFALHTALKAVKEFKYPWEKQYLEMSKDFIPWRRNVTFLPSKETPIAPLLEHLTFIQDKQKWGFPFRRGCFEISQEDFQVISTAMGVR